jgi:hypothetical protein
MYKNWSLKRIGIEWRQGKIFDQINLRPSWSNFVDPSALTNGPFLSGKGVDLWVVFDINLLLFYRIDIDIV